MKKGLAEKLIGPSFVSSTVSLCFGIYNYLDRYDFYAFNKDQAQFFIGMLFFVIFILLGVLTLYCIFIIHKD